MSSPTVVWSGSTDPESPLIVVAHGRGSNERHASEMTALVPQRAQVAALRGPIEVGPDQFTWFQNKGIGRPQSESLRTSMDWFRTWLDEVAPAPRRVGVVGFSGGAAFAGALVLDDPSRYLGVALLYGTVPFDAGLSTEPGVLDGSRVLHVQATDDEVMPRDLMERTWQFLRLESGANVVALRTTGGHALVDEAAQTLTRWLEHVL